ncbi:hypothetical protein G7Z17_g11478 [Cylindrodendrum hubeiense]|uniref:Uncharacterized protein n=1 Tax=Cylindrodendrum hubeiense TaxID=595255 RepID=A0A9P5LBL0_9HYPO|nr:hypothetical protein G7Z17_g11478 [Cylindrodendrum hubeiense]
MITSGWQSPTSLEHNNEGNSLARTLLFCSNRAWRGGFRVVLQVSAVLLTIFILFGLLPERMGGGSNLTGYKDILTWKAEPEQLSNLRIVVFGSPDVAGSSADKNHVRTTWTEELCKQMNCTSHISFVPTGESSHGLVSNDIYAHEISALNSITSETNITDQPALDYDFVGEQYPVPDSPDLTQQIKAFLAMPPPDAVPHETLWIFTFGTWEIWNMATLPLGDAEELVDSMTTHLFAQIEHLYKHSLGPDSIAFSDFWSNATESQVRELAAPDASASVDDRKLESFRILIPKLFDISLTPGWRGRPVPPFPNTEAEHTRNAVWLTRYWNQAIDTRLSAWKDKRAQKPDGVIDETDGHVVKRAEEGADKQSHSIFDYLPAAMRSKALNATEAAAERVIYAPYPLRNGLQIDPTKTILNAMTEEEMQRAEIRDSQGRGTLSTNDSLRFLDVWTPCVRAITEDLTVDMEEVTEECSIPHDHLFYDAFTIGQRAIVEVTKPILVEVLDKLFVRQPKSSWFY